jgi:methionine aminotransferase
VDSKLPDIGTTIFTVMSKMAADHDAINLSQGYPDFSVPAALAANLARHVAAGHNQYPPMHGVAALREQISLKTRTCYNILPDPESEITITSGATEALFVAIQALVNRDDEVIVFDPAYDAYEPAVTLAGGKTIHVQLRGSDFHVDWDEVRQAVTARTRAIIVNSPHNPTGATFSTDDLNELASIIAGNDIYLISDEVYEHMVFDQQKHQSLLTHDELRSRSFVISSFGKTFHATGWKVGYCIAPAALTFEFRKVHQFVTFTTHTPTQWAIADFLEQHPEHYIELPAFYGKKRDLFIREVADIGFVMRPSAGTYFQMADYNALVDDKSPEGDVQFVTRLTREAGVAAIPVSVFYRQPPASRMIRFCFAKEDATLILAAKKMRQYFSGS